MCMPKRKQESDSVYFLKILLFFILGSIWLVISGISLPPLPIGLIIGVVFASHDHFQIDRKIEYAILLAASIVSYIAPIGISIVI